MAARNLTARFCESVKPTPGKQTAYPDTDARGLELRVSAEGRKVWCFRYRTLEGQQKRLTLGVYAPDGQGVDADTPDDAKPLDLKQARIAARKARASADAGGDPAAEKVAKRAKAKAEPVKTFDDLVTGYFKACETGRWRPRKKVKRARTLHDERGVYRRHIKAALGALRVEAVTRAHVRDLLEGMAERGIGAQTNRAHALIRQVFNYAISRDRVALNPTQNVETVAPVNARERVLTDAELKRLWTTLSSGERLTGADGEPVYFSRPTAICLQLLCLLLLRRVEVTGMMVSELRLDQRQWLIPPERMKNNQPHLVPLPPTAVALIEEALELAKRRVEQDGQLPNDFPVFPGKRPNKPMRHDSVTHAMRAIADALGITKATPHDLRRTGSTALTSERLKVSHFIRSLVLSHTSDTGGGAAVSSQHYDANQYVSEKRQALEAWEGLLLEIVGVRPRPSNVIPMMGAAS